MRWAGTHDGGRLQRDAGQFQCTDRQAQQSQPRLRLSWAFTFEEICSLHTRRDVQRGQIADTEWSWSAQSFSSFWMMRISFTVAKITALTVHHGVRRALAAHAEL